ncbi:MAG: GTPase [Alphaproteobacteria bacterium]
MALALQQARASLGPDAVIVSTQTAESGRGVRITAAIETPDDDDIGFEGPAGIEAARALGTLSGTLDRHNVPIGLRDQILNAAGNLRAPDSTMGLAAALDSLYAFSPFPPRIQGKPLVFVGPPGIGKTSTVAKLAARAVLGQHPIAVISADSTRAGGIEQLEAITRILRIDLAAASDARSLTDAVAVASSAGSPILIDSAGINPFAPDEMGELATLVAAADAEPILVLAAGLDAAESAEIADAFATGLGCKRLVATRLDTARRLGNLLVAASAGNLRFTDAAFSAGIADGLAALTPVALARVLMSDGQANALTAQPYATRETA